MNTPFFGYPGIVGKGQYDRRNLICANASRHLYRDIIKPWLKQEAIVAQIIIAAQLFVSTSSGARIARKIVGCSNDVSYVTMESAGKWNVLYSLHISIQVSITN